MRLITAGWPFLDIDAYASSVALAELLRLKDEDAIAASSAPLNASIPPFLRTLNVQFERNYSPSQSDTFTLVDVSNPQFFDFNIPPDKVTQIIDHRPEFKSYWEEKIGDGAHIEHLGAACTQIYELWQEAGLAHKMSSESALLLACGILDNTLNFKAKITTTRDKQAYDALITHAQLGQNLPEKYFGECQIYALSDVQAALQNDTKPQRYPGRGSETIVGQFVLWDAEKLTLSNRRDMCAFLASFNQPWFMNLIDIRVGKSIFLCDDPELKNWLNTTLDVTFNEDVATANRMWLRKEIMKQAIERSGE